MEFLGSFLRRHFAGKPVVASQNIGSFSGYHSHGLLSCVYTFHSQLIYGVIHTLSTKETLGVIIKLSKALKLEI